MAKQPKIVTFFSNATRHFLIRIPGMDAPTAGGQWSPVQQQIDYQFEPALNDDGLLVGRLDVVVGEKKCIDHHGWLTPGAEQGIERDSADALRVHRLFNEDFWEAGWAPGTVVPRPQDFRSDLMTASVNLDEEKLVEMLDQERATHGRSDLIVETEVALDQVRKAVAAAIIADQQQQEEAAAAKPKAKASA